MKLTSTLHKVSLTLAVPPVVLTRGRVNLASGPQAGSSSQMGHKEGVSHSCRQHRETACGFLVCGLVRQLQWWQWMHHANRVTMLKCPADGILPQPALRDVLR
jgi:hypothetical protein